MRTNAFSSHLTNPFTYTDTNGETGYLSSKEISRVTVIVLSSMAVATFEAINSQRSLKSSFVSIGILAGAVFYLAAAMMKIASRGNGSSPQLKAPLNHEPIRGDHLEQQPDSPKLRDGELVIPQTPQPPEDLQAGSSVTGQADGIEEGDDSERGKNDEQDRPARIDSPDLRSPSGAEQAELREEKNAVQAQKTYQHLSVKDNEARVISEMISMINNTVMIVLLAKEQELIHLGNQIEQVHPLKFLETVLNNNNLKQAMRKIEGSRVPVKWKGFLYGKPGGSPGFIAKCQREHGLGNIEPYLTDFCLVVKVDLKKVRPLYDANNWEELIRFLVKN